MPARLNGHQITHRARAIRSYLDDATEDDAMQVMEKSGFFDRMVDAGKMRLEGMVPVVDYEKELKHLVPEEPNLTVEEQRERLVSALAILGRRDPAAANAWSRLVEAEKDVDTFNIVVNITPYRIKDSSLKSIVQDCDLKIMSEIFDGIEERMTMDEAPQRAFDDFKRFRSMWVEYAELAMPWTKE